MSESRAAVVVLNFNGRHFLEKFLPAIIAHSAPSPVYLADNGSTDGSVNYVQSFFKTVKVIANGANHGYALGYNMALKQVDADYFILLNSDVEVTPDWIAPMKKLLDKDPTIAACQPKLLDYKMRDTFEYAGAAGGHIDKLGYPFCRGRIFTTLEKDQGQYNGAAEIFWATGACLFVRSKAFWEAGALDAGYFAHMEEIDLCWRLKNLGHKIYAQPASTVYHLGGGTLDKNSTRKTFLNFRNNLTTLTKNHPAEGLLLKILARLVLDGIAGLKFLLDAQPAHCLAVLRAHFAYYSRIPAILRKRKEFLKIPGARLSTGGMYRRSVVLAYFVRNKKNFTALDGGFFPEQHQAH
jgi:GT2 family glycosyltransferase